MIHTCTLNYTSHSNKTIRITSFHSRKEEEGLTFDEVDEKDKHEKLIGQLKAAEARNRIRIMRLRYEANRGQEINHLISCQPTARKAVRLQALIPVKHEDRSQGDKLDKLSVSSFSYGTQDSIILCRST